MIISVNWLKKFTDITMPIDELATLIGARLVEIESMTDLAEKYKDVLVVKVVECAPLEGSDHLNLTKIDDGGITKDIERDEKGLIQVVCGAPNVHADMMAAWLPVGSVVPETFGDTEPFVLTAKNLRGQTSNGMLASAKELDLFDDHSGIMEIESDVKPGTKLADLYELNDYLLDIENKSLTHRPDTFGIIGFAREVAAISGNNFVTPEWLAHVQPVYEEKVGTIAAPTITIDDPTLSSRYVSVVMSNADSHNSSPLEVQTYLSRVGVRPINAVVDVTNYLMLLSAQPLHAFDYDKVVALAGGKADIHVRSAKVGEKLELLDGRIVELAPEDIVITAGETAIGLAGAMGGANTIIDENTKNIIVESASFNLYNLRATQMRHGIFSEAITRFTKGQPPALAAPVLAEAIRLLHEWSGAHRASDVSEATGSFTDNPLIEVSTKGLNELLGTSLAEQDVLSTLRRVEFAALELDDDTIAFTAPYWRADIHIPEDVIEEVGRIRGYDHIPLSLPSRTFRAVSPSAFDHLRSRLRSILVRSGANEVLTYSFVHGDILMKAGQKPEDSYRVTNSISPDLQYYRQSLTPSLLQLVHPNSKNGFESFALFELNKTHPKQRGLTDEKVPDEANAFALVIANKKAQSGAAYYEAKNILDFMAKSLGLIFDYVALDQEVPYPTAAPFEYRRSAAVVDRKSGEQIGMVGEYKKSVIKAFKLPDYEAGFELDTDAIMRAADAHTGGYEPLSRYPSTERDICFQVRDTTLYSTIAMTAEKSLSQTGLQYSVSPVDIYQPGDGETKNITIRIRLTPLDHTLSASEISETINMVTDAVIDETQATVI